MAFKDNRNIPTKAIVTKESCNLQHGSWIKIVCKHFAWPLLFKSGLQLKFTAFPPQWSSQQDAKWPLVWFFLRDELYTLEVCIKMKPSVGHFKVSGRFSDRFLIRFWGSRYQGGSLIDSWSGSQVNNFTEIGFWIQTVQFTSCWNWN